MTRLEFEGGITVEGEVITGTRNRKGKVLLVSFKNCTVKHYDEVLFHPDWGVYDIAIGKTIVAAYAGPADPTSFDMVTHELEPSKKRTEVLAEVQVLRDLYAKVRKMRQDKTVTDMKITEFFDSLKKHYPAEWLLPIELYELAYGANYVIKDEIKNYLLTLMTEQKEVAHLIEDGIYLVENPIFDDESALQPHP